MPWRCATNCAIAPKGTQYSVSRSHGIATGRFYFVVLFPVVLVVDVLVVGVVSALFFFAEELDEVDPLSVVEEFVLVDVSCCVLLEDVWEVSLSCVSDDDVALGEVVSSCDEEDDCCDISDDRDDEEEDGDDVDDEEDDEESLFIVVDEDGAEDSDDEEVLLVEESVTSFLSC